MFSKQFITIPHPKDLFFGVLVMHLSFIFTLSCENRKCSLILSHAVAEITELWEVELLDYLVLINKLPGINAVVRSLSHF